MNCNLMIKKNKKSCSTSRFGTIAMCIVPLAGCLGAGIEETRLPKRVDYHCANSKVLQVERAKDASAAAVLINGKPVILQRANSAAQEKYTNGHYTLYLHGERAMLEANSQVLFGPCNAGPLPKKMREGFSER